VSAMRTRPVMSDAGRTEAAAEALIGEESGYCGPGYGTCGSLHVSRDHAADLARVAVAAADEYDREHGIFWVQVDDAAIARVADALGPRIAVNRNVTKAARAAIAALIAPVGALGEAQ